MDPLVACTVTVPVCDVVVGVDPELLDDDELPPPPQPASARISTISKAPGSNCLRSRRLPCTMLKKAATPNADSHHGKIEGCCKEAELEVLIVNVTAPSGLALFGLIVQVAPVIFATEQVKETVPLNPLRRRSATGIVADEPRVIVIAPLSNSSNPKSAAANPDAAFQLLTRL